MIYRNGLFASLKKKFIAVQNKIIHFRYLLPLGYICVRLLAKKTKKHIDHVQRYRNRYVSLLLNVSRGPRGHIKILFYFAFGNININKKFADLPKLLIYFGYFFLFLKNFLCIYLCQYIC